MNIIKTDLDGVLIIEDKSFGDHRGWFKETYSKQKFIDNNLDYDFVQDNHSFSKEKGTLRGLHFQIGEAAQAKLVRCTRGSVLDVAVDLRKDSPTFKKWVAVELSEDNNKQLLIPRGFGHGFLTLTNDVEFQYKVDNYYSAEHDRSLLYCDEEVGIDWQIENPIVSDKDLNAKRLSDILDELF